MLLHQLPTRPGHQVLLSRRSGSAVVRHQVRVAAPSTAAAPAADPVPTGQQQQQQLGDSTPTDKKKVSFVSLGCPKNVVDGECIKDPEGALSKYELWSCALDVGPPAPLQQWGVLAQQRPGASDTVEHAEHT